MLVGAIKPLIPRPLKRAARSVLYRFFAPQGQKLVPQDWIYVPPGQRIFDPAVFGTYDRKTERIVPQDDPAPIPEFSFDMVERCQHSGVDADRYHVALRQLTPGSGLCLDACTNSPRKDVTTRIEALGYRYQAIDVDGDGKTVIREDLTKLSFPSGSIARVISCDTLEHIPAYQDALREIARVLAPDGIAILHVPTYYFDRPMGEPIRPSVDPWEHVRYHSARELAAKAIEAGLELLRVELCLDYGATVLVAAKRVAGGVARVGRG